MKDYWGSWQSAYDMMEPEDDTAERLRKYEEELEEKKFYAKGLNLKYDLDEYSLDELKDFSDKHENGESYDD